MEFEAYCDESSFEALAERDPADFMAIGGIWIPSEYRSELKNELNRICHKHNIKTEIKWKKISKGTIPLYKELLSFFYNNQNIRFRIVLIEGDKIDNVKFNNPDKELGFYKFYYQLLHHWIYDFNSYAFYLDNKTNRRKDRLKELHSVLKNSNLTSKIERVQSINSEESRAIQLADVLIGMVNTKFNKSHKEGGAKDQIIQYFENELLKAKIKPTPKLEEKFNVFKVNLEGGW